MNGLGMVWYIDTYGKGIYGIQINDKFLFLKYITHYIKLNVYL